MEKYLWIIELIIYTLYFSHSRNKSNARVGIYLLSPKGFTLYFGFDLYFLYANNVVEYKALILSLCITLDLLVYYLKIFVDS